MFTPKGKEVIVWKTFDEWSKDGYLILKGSKGQWFDNVCKFSDKQVKQKPFYKPRFTSRCGYGHSMRGSWDDADDLNTCGGPMYGIYGNCD